MNPEAPHASSHLAVYKKQLVKAYRGNRFIEALPEILDPEAEIKAIQRVVTVEKEELTAPGFLRMHMVGTFTASFLQPLDQHIELAARFSIMLRVGYLNRDPSNPAFLLKLWKTLEALAASKTPVRPLSQFSKASGGGFALIGMSGVGKSRAIEAILDTYPQIIHHTELSGPLRATYQIVWLKLSCPTDGSIKAVCRAFFTAVDALLGTDYQRQMAGNKTLEQLRDAMCSVAFMHGLGTLVIDEIQNLRRASGFNADALLRFLLVLRDDLNVPVIAIGTETAIEVLGGSMQVARRHTGMPFFDRMKFDDTFKFFCESMFKGQYLREPIKASPDILEELYKLSQGVTDFLLKIFVLAQWRALSIGLEKLSVELFREVYTDCLALLHPYIDQLRQGNAYDEVGFDDAMRATALGDLQALASSPSRPPIISTPRELASMSASRGRPTPTHTGNASKVTRRKPCEPSSCEMIRLVEDRAPDVEAYDVLKKAGIIRNLGLEVIEERS